MDHHLQRWSPCCGPGSRLNPYSIQPLLNTAVLFNTIFTTALRIKWGSLAAQIVKNLPVMQETQVLFPRQEDSLEKERECLPTPVFFIPVFANNKTDVQREHAVWPGLLVSCRTGY